MSYSNQQQRFTQFTSELAKLSEKHGIAIQSIGGITIYDDPIDIQYTNDASSGDLEYKIRKEA